MATSHGSAYRPKASRSVSSLKQLLAGDLGQERVHGQARRDRVDPHAGRRGLDRRAAGQRHDACLRGGVVGLPGLRPPAEHRRVVDDHAGLPRQHVAQAGTQTAERPGERDVEDPRPLFVGHVDELGRTAETGVVDEHVDPTELSHCCGEERDDVFFHRHVAHRGQRTGPGLLREPFSRLFEPSRVDVADEHRRAFFTRLAGDRRADPGSRCRGDDDRPAGQQAVTRYIVRRLRSRHGVTVPDTPSGPGPSRVRHAAQCRRSAVRLLS